MFEAGALAKNLDQSRVCPILFDLEPSDVVGPLVQFQAARFEKSNIRKVIGMINNELGATALTESVLNEVFEMWWPRLEENISNISRRHEMPPKSHIRSERELIEEILGLVRLQAKNIPSVTSPALRRGAIFEDYYNEEVRNFASVDRLLGKDDDPNSRNWIEQRVLKDSNALDGLWFGRWMGGVTGREWKEGSALIKTVGDKVYILYDEAGQAFLIVTQRQAENRLVGRYYRLEGDVDGTPWVGLIVNEERIDGAWLQGRWDFRRVVQS